METSPHNLSHLFQQLGLPGDAQAIESFISTHRLPPGTTLACAPFWSPAQAQFLAQSLAHDADWAEAADELAARLS